MSKIFVTSDLHFFHKNILKFNPRTRPFADVHEMNEGLINNWNSVVAPEDDVYDLGDFAFAGMQRQIEILERLNGRHHLIRGNHDNTWQKESNIDQALRNGWFYSVQDYRELRYKGTTVVLFHYGQRVWNKSHHGTFMLYGHSHGSLPSLGRSMDVGIDSDEMDSHQTPFLLDDVLNHLSQKEIVVVDHHNNKTGE